MTRIDCTCLHCGKAFQVDPYKIREGKGKYCSVPCYQAAVHGRTIEERFWANVSKSDDPNGCWFWTGNISPAGYGKFKMPGIQLAPRASWTLHFGPIPDGLFVLHSCDVNYATDDITYRRCIRPDHLFLGTAADNAAWKIRVGRGRWNPQRGEAHHKAKLTQAQVAEIRARYAEGGIIYRELGAIYGVNATTIGEVIRGEIWNEGQTVLHPGKLKGEVHPSAKLTADDVRLIRERWAIGGISQRALGCEYGVTGGAIHAILSGRNWKDAVGNFEHHGVTTSNSALR